MKTRNQILKMVLAAFFLALAYVMPFLTGQIPEIGSMLCPMHIPVLLCGFVCGWQWGLTVGIIAPLMRSLILGMPPIFPTAVCMAFELAAYGALCGIFYKLFPKKIPFTYCALIISMLLGRLVWGAAMLVCMGMAGKSFGFAAFTAGAFTNAIPGIIVQIIIVPIIVIVLEKASVFKKLS